MMGSDQAAQGDTALATLAAILRAAGRVAILTHRNPDGDTIGAATALASGLRRLGVESQVVCPDPLPANLLAIPGAGAVARTLAGEYDLVVSVDVSDYRMLEPLPAASAEFFGARPSANIDHHISNLRYARFNYVDPGAAAAAEIVAELLHLLGLTIDSEAATQLLYGIVNDTHSFQNSNTTPRTLRLAADLVEAGADLALITFTLLLSRSAAAARLWAETLPTLTFEDNGRVASMVVSLAALSRSGAQLAEADGLVEFLRAIRDVDLAVLYKQIGPERYRLSLRSTPVVDATAIARVFGGGGHRQAAGCDANGPIADVTRAVLQAYRTARADTGA